MTAPSVDLSALDALAEAADECAVLLRRAITALKAANEEIALHIANKDAAIEVACAEEREACARVADDMVWPDELSGTGWWNERVIAQKKIAAAIRNRTPSPPAEENKT